MHIPTVDLSDAERMYIFRTSDLSDQEGLCIFPTGDLSYVGRICSPQNIST